MKLSIGEKREILWERQDIVEKDGMMWGKVECRRKGRNVAGKGRTLWGKARYHGNV